MRFYFLLIFLIGVNSSFGQVKYYDECKLDPLFITLQHPASFGNDSTSLQKYFDSILNNITYHLTGKILIQVYIDASGIPCCNSIVKTNDQDIDFDQMKSVINSMPKWNAGIQNGFKVNSRIGIVLSLIDKKPMIKITSS
jgi:hypothetical protein